MPVTVRSSVERVTLTPARWSGADRMAREVGDDPGLDVRGRAQVERDRRERAGAATRSGSSAAVTPCATRRTPRSSTSRTRSGPATSPACAVSARPAVALPRHERDRVRGSRPRGLRPGEVEADAPAGRSSAATRASSTLAAGRMLPHGRHDQADERAWQVRVARGPRAMPAATASMTAATDMPRSRWSRGAQRTSAYRTPSAARSSTSSSVDSLEGLGGLEQRDRQVEEGEQLRLVRAALGADHAPPRLVERERHADRLRQLDRGRRADGSVQVLVQLGLRKGTQGVEVASAHDRHPSRDRRRGRRRRPWWRSGWPAARADPRLGIEAARAGRPRARAGGRRRRSTRSALASDRPRRGARRGAARGR